MADKDGKTEKPTSIKRRRAQEEGQIAFSSQVTQTASLVCGMVMFAWVLSFRGGFRGYVARLLDNAVMADDPHRLGLRVMNDTAVYFVLLVAPVLASVWVGALAGSIVQGMPKYASKALEPKWERLNPKQGLQKLKTKIQPVEWGRLLVLLGVLIVAVYTTLSLYWPTLMRSPGVPIEASNDLLRTILIRVLTYVLLALAVLAVIDLIVVRYRHEKSLKQTKSEVKEDNKQMDGNPEVKGKVRSIQREQAKQRMMAAIEDADVIITNPTHYAVALEYKPDLMAAPKVVAKGQGWLAQKIKEVGREYDIPRVENVPLARALYRSVEVDQEIPMHLYKAVAEVLAYVFKVHKRMKRKV